jgi:hypothetical protein
MCSTFVLMMHGHPISAKLPDELGFSERFWYWKGFSGKSYIHSIYSRHSCPPLPGAVYVAVRHIHGVRRAIAVGRLPSCVEGSFFDVANHLTCIQPDDEIHVHLLACDNNIAVSVLRDLEQALTEVAQAEEVQHFSEAASVDLIAA